MSREMRNFADYFMRGMQLGAGWAEKWQADQIAKERMKLQDQQFRTREAREERRLGLYGQNVAADIELKRARAQAALRPKGGGGGGGAAAVDPHVDRLEKEALKRGIIAQPTPEAAPAAAGNVTNIYPQGDGADLPAVQPEAEGEGISFQRKGGMVRKMAGGGSIEEGAEMSIGQAMSYGKAKPKGGAFGSGAQAAAGKPYKTTIDEPAPKDKPPEQPRATGPVGSGPAGSYTTDDLQPGGVLSYAEGGAVDLTQPFDARRAQAEATQRMDELQQRQQQQNAKSIEGYSGSANGGTGSSGDAGGGVSGDTGGVGGSATDGSGGSAAAGTSGDAGSDGGGTYRRGGRVRRFQSGGRVMEAIDTGTSGPGSGFGYRAAPPARRY